eukprot:scaffold36382_cov61-Phaeocystis_antarctica.AAC.1
MLNGLYKRSPCNKQGDIRPTIAARATEQLKTFGGFDEPGQKGPGSSLLVNGATREKKKQLLSPGEAPRRGNTRGYLSSCRGKSSVTSAPSPNSGTAEALSRRPRHRRSRWRCACAALPRRTRIA